MGVFCRDCLYKSQDHFNILQSCYNINKSRQDGTEILQSCHPGRTALLMAIDNENLEMIELLLEFKVGKHNKFNKVI